MTFNKVVFDIETTMTADKIWCIVCKHNDTYYQFREITYIGLKSL